MSLDNGSWDRSKKHLLDKIIRVLVFLLVIGIVAGIFLLYRNNPGLVDDWKEFGYTGVFLICLIANASIILPVPGLLIVLSLGAILNPWLVGLAGGAGAAVGEITGYLAGYSGQPVARRINRYENLVRFTRRWGGTAIFVFSLIPFLPFDIVGITAGLLRFRFWQYLVITLSGRAILYVLIAWLGAWGINLFA
jgi:uncharacterized membrane protein YdjX (TVP38/TMEM64 family)